MKRVMTVFVLLGLAGCSDQTRDAEVVSVAPDSGSAAGTTLSARDRDFIYEAAMGGMMEVRLGEIGARQAAAAPVKEFAERMIEDHGRANNELMQIAGARSVRVPGELQGRQRRTVDRLSRLNGPDFDREYIRLMVEEHRQDLNSFRRQAAEGQDPELKAFAERTAGVIEQHLRHAEELNAAMRRPAGAPTAAPPAEGAPRGERRGAATRPQRRD